MPRTMPCPRCAGKGQIPGYGHVLGGVCFKCGGSGKVPFRAVSTKPKWAVSAVLRETGERVSPVFHVRASNEEQALKEALRILSRGENYIPETTRIEGLSDA